MSDVYAELLSTALVGTDRRQSATLTAGGALGDALALVAADDPAAALLDAAALATVHRRAGVLPMTDVAIPTPAPAETRPEVPPAAAHRLISLLDAETSAVLEEWLHLVAAREMRVPAWTLPQMLDRARLEIAVRVPMLAVGGHRMRWLAAQNPDWNYLARVAGETDTLDDDDWDLGDDGRRLDHLRALRGVDPAAGRGKLAAAWAAEDPRQRAALLETIEVGLSADDEEFLESALDDRRKEVRRVAAALLNQVPGSAFTQRMADRMLTCVTIEDGVPRFAAPAEFDAAMRRDGLTAPRGPAGGSIGVECLDEILNAAPMAAWRALRLPLPALLKAAESDDVQRIVTAISVAAARESDADAATTLLSWRGAHRYPWLFDRLLPSLSPEARHRVVIEGLGAGKAAGDRAYQLLASCPRPWSVELGRAALDLLRRGAQSLGYRAHRWSALLGERLPVDLLAEAATLAAAPEHDDAYAGLTRLGELATLRLEMHKELA